MLMLNFNVTTIKLIFLFMTIPGHVFLKTFGKIETASAIFWDYLGMFREYGQKKFF